jgi:glutamyl-tRNA synthetase
MRLRFAPSPTGSLHVGGARTAILNWLLVRRHGGTFMLRIEDTDTVRNLPGAETALLEDLHWLGLDWDEGPGTGGAHGPYRQSERGEIHRAAAERLLAAGHAYHCTCPPQAEEAQAQRRARCACADAAGPAVPLTGAVVRFRAPEQPELVVRDAIRGDVVYPGEVLEDFVLLRSDGRATYNFAAAVDDAAMEITHVIRGADHLNNTPKQMMVYRALGQPTPVFAHIPLILGADRQKLSKRHGATSVAEHRRQGYLPEALVNYLSLLAWSSPSGEEFLPLERLVAEVALERVGSADAVFDPEKLRWLSHRHIQQLSVAELQRRLAPHLNLAESGIAPERLPLALETIRERISLLSEAAGELEPFGGPARPEHHRARAALATNPAAVALLAAVADRLQTVEPWEPEAVGAAVREAGAAAGAKGKALFRPVRVALTGEEHGPDLARLACVLGRERTVRLLRTPGDFV